MKKGNRKKRAAIALLSLALIGSATGGLYRYWAENINNPSNITKEATSNVGTAKAIQGTIESSHNEILVKNLVPANRTAQSAPDSVERLTQTITTRWVDATNVVKASDNVTGNLKIVPIVTFGDGVSSTTQNLEILQKLVKVSIKSNLLDMSKAGSHIVLNGNSPINSTVEVTMTEPETKAEYDAVKGKPFKITFTYSIAQTQAE